MSWSRPQCTEKNICTQGAQRIYHNIKYFLEKAAGFLLKIKKYKFLEKIKKIPCLHHLRTALLYIYGWMASKFSLCSLFLVFPNFNHYAEKEASIANKINRIKSFQRTVKKITQTQKKIRITLENRIIFIKNHLNESITIFLFIII